MTNDTIPDQTKIGVTVDFDHHDEALAAAPYETYEVLRTRCPVTWTPAYGGFWVLTDHASVLGAARDADLFQSGQGTLIPSPPFAALPVDTDSPHTQQLRRMIHDRLSPQAVLLLEPRIYEIADSLVDQFIERGECDVVEEFAKPLPVRTFMPLLGIEEEGWREFASTVTDVSHKMNRDPDAAFVAAIKLSEDFMAIIDDRRTNGPREDIVSALLQGRLDGEPLSDEQLIAYLLTLIGGGIFTTRPPSATP